MPREEKEKQRVEEGTFEKERGWREQKEKKMKEKTREDEQSREGAYVPRGDPLPTLPSSPSRARRSAAPLCFAQKAAELSV